MKSMKDQIEDAKRAWELAEERKHSEARYGAIGSYEAYAEAKAEAGEAWKKWKRLEAAALSEITATVIKMGR